MSRLFTLVTRHPWFVVAFWLIAASVLGAFELAGPLDLSRLTAEAQAELLPKDIESAQAADLIWKAWPDQGFRTSVVAVLGRKHGKLTAADHDYARRLAATIIAPGHPANLLRVLGPASRPEIAQYLRSEDGTTQLLVTHMDTSFVSPTTFTTVGWLESIPKRLRPPAGLDVTWTGDAVLGRDYLDNVHRSLDRAALATVGLLLIVLLIVYRSIWVSLVPLVTIGMSFVIVRGVLAALARAGWAMSPLVELFLVVILFGCGTDFCLFLSWRFGENWNAANPGAAMRTTMRRASEALLTSAGTVIAGLSLMGFTRFQLFSSTGPSVALGLAITVCATLTLAPALLVLLAGWWPRAFVGLTRPSSGFWNNIGRLVLAHPIVIWVGTVGLLAAVAIVGGAHLVFSQDLAAELPAESSSVRGLHLVAEKYGAGRVAPLTVLLKTSGDFHNSRGLALIDDVSRLLAHQRRLREVRSATQPLGSTDLLDPARLDARLTAMAEGFQTMVAGATELKVGLTHGVDRLRAARLIEKYSGISLTGLSPSRAGSNREKLLSGLREATTALFGSGGNSQPQPQPDPDQKPAAEKKPTVEKKPAAEKKSEEVIGSPLDVMIQELNRAAEGSGQIADGAKRARAEIQEILADPVGRQALNHLLLTPKNIREHPELQEAFQLYISPDGHLSRIDLTQTDRVFSPEALDQVVSLRRQVREWLNEMPEPGGGRPRAAITGANAVAEDTRRLTNSDQVLSWFMVPAGVFVVLLITLRDPLAGLNVIAAMVLSYLFALGVTHLVFVTGLHADGIDWKVPYFLFVLLVAVGVDYSVFLMTRLREESRALGARAGINRAIAQTGGLITSAAAITACSFAALVFSPLSSLRQLGVALVIGIAIEAVLVHPVLVPCGQWLLMRRRERPKPARGSTGSIHGSRPDFARIRD